MRKKSIFSSPGKLSSNLLTIPLTVSQVQVPLPLAPHIVSHLPVEPNHLLLTDLFPGIQINQPRSGKEITFISIDLMVFHVSRPNRDHQKWHKNHQDFIPVIHLLRPNQAGRLYFSTAQGRTLQNFAFSFGARRGLEPYHLFYPHLKMNLFLLSFRFPSTSNPSAVPVYSASGEPEPGTGYEATSPSLNWDSHRSVKARSHLHINPHLLPLTPMLHSIHLSHHQRRICAQASDAFRTCKGNQS